MLTTSTWLMLAGAILVLLGFAMRWKVSAYDLKDAAIDSAWTLARGRRTANNPTALEVKYRDIQNQPTWTGRATKTAGTVAGHFIAQVLGVAALIMMLAGLALGVAGFLWR
ncbi:MAG TPA: hypothetical protein VFR73_07210 [Hyphomicrobiaceae bacterium]|jgi:hypothetical protein|nr:hypothetical protein [Hyphomicrobiaceae bacterium]